MAGASSAGRQLKCRTGFCITVSADQVSAYLALVPTELEGIEITQEDVRKEIERAGIIYGILSDNIRKVSQNKSSGEKLPIAQGDPPRHGQDARIQYLFDTSRKHSPKEDKDGRIDYKELAFIQNAAKGDVLARKIPATTGTPGKSVFGKPIKALSGRDKAIPQGTGTVLSENGIELIAEIDGSLVFNGSVVNIATIQNISGSVDSSTGNIECNGSLRISKDIQTGFKVKVAGDLEIGGQVQDAEVECGGNVIVKGGFFGGGNGKITAKGDITVKWVEGQTLHSEKTLTIGGEALNCKLYGTEAVIVTGSKGKIVGGEASSKFLIRAPELGSSAGTMTELRVAYDVETIKKLRAVDDEIQRLTEDRDRVKEGLTALYKLQMSGRMPPDKEAALPKLEAFLKSLPGQLKELQAEQEKLRNRLREIENAVIIGEKATYPGVKLCFGVLYKEVHESMGATKFQMEYDTIVPARLTKEDLA